MINNTTNATSPNDTTTTEPQWISQDARIVFGLLYIIVIFIGVSGNVLVVLAVTTIPTMKSVTNIFIANLAVADLIVTMLCCPLLLIHMLSYPNWTLGKNMCYITSVLIHLSLTASSIGLLAISIDRYLAIAHAQKQLMTFRKVNVMVVITWVVSVLLAMPSAFIRPDTSAIGRPADVCLVVWRSSDATEKFEMFKGLLFVTVFAHIAFFYYRIAHVLWTREVPGNRTNENQAAASMARKKVVKLLLIVLASFLGCWAPMMIYRVITMNLPDRKIQFPKALYTGATALAMANSAMNPVLYALFNRNFRMAFRNIYRKCFNNQVLPIPDAFSVPTNQAPTTRQRHRSTVTNMVTSSNGTGPVKMSTK